MNISVIGGGHGCYAAAIELAEKGHSVRLWRRDSAALEKLQGLGHPLVRDFRGERRLSLGQHGDALTLTADLAQAVADAQLLVIAMPSTSHEALARGDQRLRDPSTDRGFSESFERVGVRRIA